MNFSKGYGILALWIPLPFILLCGFAIRFNGVGYLLGGGVSAAALWFLGRRLNREVGQEFIHPDTGERIQILAPAGHTLNSMPIQYWAFVYFGIGVEEFVRHM